MSQSFEATVFATGFVLMMSIILAGLSSWLITLFLLAKVRGKPFHEVLNETSLVDSSARIIFILAYIIALGVVFAFALRN